MAELPILPLKTDALISDTTHMSAEEFGAYCRILIAMWRHEAKLPDDAVEIARIAGVGKRRWATISGRVMRPLTVAGGWVTQKRLTATWLDVQELRRKRAEGVEHARKSKKERATFDSALTLPGNNLVGKLAEQVIDFSTSGLSKSTLESTLKSTLKSTPNQNQTKKDTSSSFTEPRAREGGNSGDYGDNPKNEANQGETLPGEARSLATALPTGALARTPPLEQVAKESKPPSKITAAELVEMYRKKRKANGRHHAEDDAG